VSCWRSSVVAASILTLRRLCEEVIPTLVHSRMDMVVMAAEIRMVIINKVVEDMIRVVRPAEGEDMTLDLLLKEAAIPMRVAAIRMHARSSHMRMVVQVEPPTTTIKMGEGRNELRTIFSGVPVRY